MLISNLDPISLKKKLGPTSVALIFYAPKVANLGFWKMGPTIAL